MRKGVITLCPMEVGAIYMATFRLGRLFLNEGGVSFSGASQLICYSGLVMVSPREVGVGGLMILLFGSVRSPSFVVVC